MPRRSSGKFGPDGQWSKKRMSALADVAGRIKGWKPAREVLTSIRAVPTLFPQLDVGMRVGGWPLQRIAVVHGPSANGKTVLCHGLGLSFLRAAHFYCYVDAEFTTPESWLVQLMGTEMASLPTFLAKRPRTFEDTTDAVSSAVETVANARERREIPPETTVLVVVDSIKKLVPKRLQEKIENHAAESSDGSVDGMKGAAAMYKAALNSAWLDQLAPLMYHTGATLVLVGREAENVNAGSWDRKWKLTGGGALIFDSSVLIRVVRDKWIKLGDKVVGEKHLADVYKTKLAGKDDKTIRCYFHTSNGMMTPAGFDVARDLFDMGRRCGLIRKNKKKRFECTLTGEVWVSENDAVKKLSENPGSLEALRSEMVKAASADYMEVSDEDAADG